jgi:Nucleotidyl transferase AbiEii toxin, Type IV TA system
MTRAHEGLPVSIQVRSRATRGTWVWNPALLDFPPPRLRAYRPETAIAEKLHAMVVLGEANSRMRDFFDIHALAQHERFEGDVLSRALRATFERRRTPIPEALPLALTPAFAAIREKQVQWQGFLHRNGVLTAPPELATVVAGIAVFLEPVIAAARRGRALRSAWSAGGPWSRAVVAEEPVS